LQIDQEKEMTQKGFLATAGLFLLLGWTTCTAQVKQVQMHIEGYLCGN
jgi:hypothetical protein